MNNGQRWLVIVALGLGLGVLAGTVNGLIDGGLNGGWFNYAPNNGLALGIGGRLAIVRQAAVWLGAIGVWLVAGWRLLD